MCRIMEVMMRQQTRQDHEERLEEAVRYILAHLDGPIDSGDLADHVCLSRYHFHRVFQALVGETVGEMIRRLRLERAASRLRTSRTPITELAFEAGYATHEAFIRAFRAAFGYTPSTMRHKLSYDGLLPTPNGVHYGKPLHLRFVPSEGETTLQVEIRQSEPRKAVCMSHHGPYFMIGKTFGEISAWIGENNLEQAEMIGIYYDDPSVTPAEKLRSDAGMFVPNDYATDDPCVHVVEVAGGTYAVATHFGTYDGLSNAWGELMGKWLPTSGYGCGFALANQPSFEVYINDCDKVPPAEIQTELWLPVIPPTES